MKGLNPQNQHRKPNLLFCVAFRYYHLNPAYVANRILTILHAYPIARSSRALQLKQSVISMTSWNVPCLYVGIVILLHTLQNGTFLKGLRLPADIPA